MAPAKTKEESLEDQIVRMRNDGSDWATISETTGIGQGKAALIYMQQTVDPSDRITARNDDEMAKKVVKARGDGLSWGLIMARTGLGEARLRSLFEAASGEAALGNRIGKGGRYPGNGNGSAPAASAPAKKAGAKKAAAPAKDAGKKAAAPAAKNALGDMTLAQLKARLDGQTMTVIHSRDGRQEKIAVTSVMRTKEGELTFKDAANGKTRTVLLTEIQSATNKKTAAAA